MLDQLAREEELSVDQAELSAYVTRQAEQMGVAPERLAKQLADDGRLSFAAAEVLRGKAMNLIAERVKVTDSAGHEVDVKAALNAPVQGAADRSPTNDDAERRGRGRRRGRRRRTHARDAAEDSPPRSRRTHRPRPRQRAASGFMIVKGLLLYGVLESSRSWSRSRRLAARPVRR